MATLKESAKAYTPPQKAKNIADLHQVSVKLDLKRHTGTDDQGDEFSYDYIEVDNERYRVPPSVIQQLQVLLEDNDSITTFKVVKKGAGMETRYTVIPLASSGEKAVI